MDEYLQNHQATAERLYFEQLAVGNVWESATRKVTEPDILEFANLTGDRDPLHIDPDFAAQTPFREQIAHGLLGLSFMAGLSSDAPNVHTSAFVRIENWEFLKPIFIGDTIRVETEIFELRHHGRRNGEVIWQRRVLNQRDEHVQRGNLVTLVAKKSVRSMRIDGGHTLPAPKRSASVKQSVRDEVSVSRSTKNDRS